MADGTGIGIREVSTEGTSVVACRLKAIIDLRRRCITVVHSRLVLVAGEDFLTVTIGVEVGAMLGVAVTKTGCGESTAVVVDNHRAEADFIAAVPVDVGNTEVVIAVSIPRVAPAVVVGPLPIERELMGGGIDAEGLHVVLRVTAAAEEDERMTAIEERRTEVVLRGAVTIAVAPVVGVAARKRIGHPKRCGARANAIRFARSALHIEQILDSGVGVGTVGIVVTHRVARVHVHITNLGSRAVGMMDNHVVGTTHEHLGLSVAVPVVANGVVLLVRTAHHVRSEVNPPEALALDVVNLEMIVGGLVALGIYTRGVVVGTVVALHDELRHTIAREVGQRNVVDVAIGGHVLAVTRLHGGYGKFDVLEVHAGHSSTLLLLHTLHDRCHLVLRATLAGSIYVVRDAQRLVVELCAVAIEVVLGVVILFAEDSPADEGSAARLSRNGHKSSVELVGHSLCVDGHRACHHHHDH